MTSFAPADGLQPSLTSNLTGLNRALGVTTASAWDTKAGVPR